MKKIFIIVAAIILAGGLYFAFDNSTGLDEVDLDKSAIKDKNVENENKELKEEKEEEKKITEEDLVRRDSQGPVDVAMVLNNILETNDEFVIFNIYLNTHSVDLEAIDYANAAVLIIDKEVEIKENFKWELKGGGGHHINGYLKLPNEYNGKKIFDKDTKYIELQLLDIGEAEKRTFKWDIKKINN